MKRFIYSLLCLGTLMLASCSMDHEPVGSVPDGEALQTIKDCRAFRNGFYNRIRSLSTGGYITYTEIQMDQFVGTKINGNNLGPINNGVILSSDSDFEGIWGGLYGGIADANFYLEYSQNVEVSDNDEDYVDFKRYEAECHFMRAYFYYWLLDHFCPAYTDANKDKALGLPIVTKYFPTADKSYYPSRSTLAETYKFIEDDLDIALEGLLEFESVCDSEESPARPMSPYISSYAVKALQARIALLKGEYDKAKTIALEVINSNLFPISSRSNYAAMWTDDYNNEIIFRPISTADELGISSTGSAWIAANIYQANYIPVPSLTNQGEGFLYPERDIRYSTFIGTRQLAMEGALLKCPVFIKYPGNPALDEASPNLCNMPKVFRTSELYLIVAEAAVELGDEATANDMLKTIRENRISRYTYESATGEALRQEVRKERLRELIGEGFRMSDLRRWGVGFVRDASAYPTFPQAAQIVTLAGNGVTYQPNDYRYVWPIPAAEIQVNPNMAGQQNPGYN